MCSCFQQHQANQPGPNSDPQQHPQVAAQTEPVLHCCRDQRHGRHNQPIRPREVQPIKLILNEDVGGKAEVADLLDPGKVEWNGADLHKQQS